MAFETDSGDYEFLTEAVELASSVKGMICEIGTRRGGSLKYIFDAALQFCPKKTVISIDPYGHIEYQGREGQICRLDYTNQMKYECMRDVYNFLCEHPIDFHFFDIEDIIFFEQNANGVHVYDMEHFLYNDYAMVFFDGPHYIEAIKNEISFFLPRTPNGGIWIFDDVTIDFYDHEVIDIYLKGIGFELVKIGNKKAIYKKC